MPKIVRTIRLATDATGNSPALDLTGVDTHGAGLMLSSGGATAVAQMQYSPDGENWLTVTDLNNTAQSAQTAVFIALVVRGQWRYARLAVTTLEAAKTAVAVICALEDRA